MSDVTPFVSVDYLEQARGRVTSQFAEQTVIDRYLQLLIQEQEDIQQVFKDLTQLRSIDTAFGAQLDLIGRIVGQSRELLEADIFTYFGFRGLSNAGGFGQLGDVTSGSLFWELGRPLGGNLSLDDETYRLFIKAKIIKNSTASTPEETIFMVNFLFGTTSTYINEGPASYTIFLGRQLTDLEKYLLTYVTRGEDGYDVRLLPKTNGVRINFGQFREGGYFGFRGAPGAKGFGTLRSGIGGYGNTYGFSYGVVSGESRTLECVYTTTHNGDNLYDGQIQYTGGETCTPIDAGWFAELLDVA